jgi:hypothetical protein
MGIQIQTAFTTAHGFAVSSVYCRISRIIFDPIRDPQYTVTLQVETYLTRDCRLEGKLSLPIPNVPSTVALLGTFGDMAYVYSLLKTHLESQGLTVEDVLEPTPEASPQSSESTPSTLPTPPPPSESPESSPEPQQPPSSEYAPAPATTEA